MRLQIALALLALTAPAWGQSSNPPPGFSGGVLGIANGGTGVTSGISALATLASPTFTGTPAAPTAALGTSTTQLATTAFVGSAAVKSFSKATSYDLTTATGTQALTGFGFKPSYCVGFGAVASATLGQYVSFMGVSDSARNMYVMWGGGSVQNASGKFLEGADNAGNNQAATVQSYDSDGLTLSWTKTGTPTGTFGFTVTCLQ